MKQKYDKNQIEPGMHKNSKVNIKKLILKIFLKIIFYGLTILTIF